MKTPFKTIAKAILVLFIAGIASTSFARAKVDEPKLLGVIDFGKTTIPTITRVLQK
ncbi:MAG: hypothetical protein LUC43_08605 [Burkholderiales bacterium]|nr:hypothetical protein [Burkholderiales bacterium]